MKEGGAYRSSAEASGVDRSSLDNPPRKTPLSTKPRLTAPEAPQHTPPPSMGHLESPKQKGTPEERKMIASLQRSITETHKGLREIREAFRLKASDPAFRDRGLNIDEWSRRYGPGLEGPGEILGRWADTKESRLRADARTYYVLERNLIQLEELLMNYREEHGLQ